MFKKIGVLIFVIVCFFSFFPQLCKAKQPGEKTTIYVVLEFEGDPGFPSITYSKDTTGLASFTAEAFNIPLAWAILPSFKALIKAKIIEDYSQFENVVFVFF